MRGCWLVDDSCDGGGMELSPGLGAGHGGLELTQRGRNGAHSRVVPVVRPHRGSHVKLISKLRQQRFLEAESLAQQVRGSVFQCRQPKVGTGLRPWLWGAGVREEEQGVGVGLGMSGLWGTHVWVPTAPLGSASREAHWMALSGGVGLDCPVN